MNPRIAWLRARVTSERGSVSLELVIIAPALLLILAVAIYAGRVSTAGQTVEQAASAAARTASIARTGPAAQSTATTTARTTLTQQGLGCTSTTITVDTAGFVTPVGAPAAVTVTVTCVLNTGDVAFPGIPGSQTLTGTAVSPLDSYRSRT